MRLTVLGCAGTFPGPASACSSYLLEADGFRLVLDLGSGALSALQRHIGLLDVDALVLSHLHGDHWLDATPYAFARSYFPSGPGPVLPVLAPAGARDRIGGAQGGLEIVDAAYAVEELQAGTRALGPFEVTFARMAHPVETYGVRIGHAGRVLTYSADTGPSGALVELARDADVLLCEASFDADGPRPANLHLTGGEAGEHAARPGAGRLLLTHVPPWADPARTLEAARAAYDGPAETVRADDRYEI